MLCLSKKVLYVSKKVLYEGSLKLIAPMGTGFAILTLILTLILIYILTALTSSTNSFDRRYLANE